MQALPTTLCNRGNLLTNISVPRSPKSDSVAIWSSPLEFSCLVYGLNGDLLFKYAPPIFGLGVAAVSWSPCGSVLAVAGCDGALRFFNALNW